MRNGLFISGVKKLTITFILGVGVLIATVNVGLCLDAIEIEKVIKEQNERLLGTPTLDEIKDSINTLSALLFSDNVNKVGDKKQVIDFTIKVIQKYSSMAISGEFGYPPNKDVGYTAKLASMTQRLHKLQWINQEELDSILMAMGPKLSSTNNWLNEEWAKFATRESSKKK